MRSSSRLKVISTLAWSIEPESVSRSTFPTAWGVQSSSSAISAGDHPARVMSRILALSERMTAMLVPISFHIAAACLNV